MSGTRKADKSPQATGSLSSRLQERAIEPDLSGVGGGPSSYVSAPGVEAKGTQRYLAKAAEDDPATRLVPVHTVELSAVSRLLSGMRGRNRHFASAVDNLHGAQFFEGSVLEMGQLLLALAGHAADPPQSYRSRPIVGTVTETARTGPVRPQDRKAQGRIAARLASFEFEMRDLCASLYGRMKEPAQEALRLWIKKNATEEAQVPPQATQWLQATVFDPADRKAQEGRAAAALRQAQLAGKDVDLGGAAGAQAEQKRAPRRRHGKETP